MANTKLSELSALGTTPAGSDIIPITDVSGTPTTKKVTVTNLMGASPVQSVAGRTGAVTIANTDVNGLGTAATTASTDYATAAQGVKADSATQPGDLGTVAALNVGTAATNVVQLADVSGTVKLPAVDASQLTGIEASNIKSTGETGGTKFLREDGDGTCSFQLPTADVDGPLTTALRGTTNAHMGAFPNQSFVVTDNPHKSVMVLADSAGNIEFVVNSDSASLFLTKPSSKQVASFGFSVSEDATEPDIEVTSGTENYSVISGDSDSKGVNGLPVRQNFFVPDIGANPAPLLISGGSIA